MRNYRKITIVAAVILVVGATSVAGFAASSYQTPGEALAGLTGQTVEQVIAEKQETNKSYGTMAAEAGKLDEFKAEAMEMKVEKINAQVAAGKVTQEKADTVINAIQERQRDCDGTCSGEMMQNRSEKKGFEGMGMGQGFGNKNNGEG